MKHVEFLEFCAEVNAIVNGRKDFPGWFRTHEGLCINYVSWLKNRGCESDIWIRELESLKDYFAALGMDRRYPFNNGSSKEYFWEILNGQAWTSEKRLKFVRAHATLVTELQP